MSLLSHVILQYYLCKQVQNKTRERQQSIAEFVLFSTARGRTLAWLLVMRNRGILKVIFSDR